MSLKKWSIRICFIFIQVSPSISTELIRDEENAAAVYSTKDRTVNSEEHNTGEEEGAYFHFF
jgi:hypothetical protein